MTRPASVTSILGEFKPEGRDGSEEKKKDREEEARRPEDEEEDDEAEVAEVAVRLRLRWMDETARGPNQGPGRFSWFLSLDTPLCRCPPPSSPLSPPL